MASLRPTRWISVWTFALAGAGLLAAMGQDYLLGLEEEKVIRYEANHDLADPVAKLMARLDAGQIKLDYDPQFGYLKALLKALSIPASSQALVFSKTSFQAANTSPKTPRALYFNDRVYIGWAQGSPSLDIIAIDPKKGPIFYGLSQNVASKGKAIRRNQCVGCHFGPKTKWTPGILINSVHTRADGRALQEVKGYTGGHSNPLETRWSGWYLTGRTGTPSLANRTVASPADPEQLDGSPGVDNLDAHIDTKSYVAPSSDAVALLVLDHSAAMQNTITVANYEARLALAKGTPDEAPVRKRIADAGDDLVDNLLFVGEASLGGGVRGTSSFAKEFSAIGPRDRRGRSLRELDLRRRLFRYPCSFLMYSESFDALPGPMLDYVYGRLDAILGGRDVNPKYRLDASTRTAIRQILMDTKPGYRLRVLPRARASERSR